MTPPLLPPRPHDSHKGQLGHVGIVGGAPGMVGAALLAGRAALQCGAGRVTLGVLDAAVHVDFCAPELMFAPPETLVNDPSLTVLAIGPGLGQTRAAVDLLQVALRHPGLLVIDADGLNGLAQHGDLAEACARRTAPTLLTPHPGEAARLLHSRTDAIQADREQAARQLTATFHAWVVLKGAGSVLAQPDGAVSINASGNPALSAPGMGDVLTGMLAAFLARLPPADALRLAVWLHGQAADDAVADGLGPEGLTASELIERIRHRLNANAATADFTHQA
ncbi:NAD(P)H-hydrate dehydratase [Thiobacillus sp.]|uniref:NAD(P)H-hydrate dehydratase n=1 Tax=Thiobacillus sp. TaxID=924 RepID=UPI00286DDFFF|nr:NAD(P)H-hydrate dehydratase [Thiobacillus sp.]